MYQGRIDQLMVLKEDRVVRRVMGDHESDRERRVWGLCGKRFGEKRGLAVNEPRDEPTEGVGGVDPK